MRTARTPAMRGAAAAAVVLLAAGCSSSSNGSKASDAENAAAKGSAASSAPSSSSESSSATDTEPVALSGIAKAIGCKADVQTDAATIKQAFCSTKKGKYSMVTFVSKKGQNDWLTMSKYYGGTYLVGNMWVVTASPALLLPVQEKLGGSFEAGEDHSGHSG